MILYSFEVTFFKFLLGLQLSFLFLKLSFLANTSPYWTPSSSKKEESDAEVQNLAVALWDAASNNADELVPVLRQNPGI